MQTSAGAGGGGDQGTGLPGWKLSYSVPEEERQNVAMPEPQHRIGPAGVTSGISVRNPQKPSLTDFAKICQHYEAKCGGVYSSDSAAARYLFSLSREVQYVAEALMQETSNQTRASVEAEKLLAEWKQEFGPEAPLVRDVPSLGLPVPGGSGGGDGGDGNGGAEGDSVEESRSSAGAEKKDDDDDAVAAIDSTRVDDGFTDGIGSAVSPAKVAEALRYLARRVKSAERGESQATRERVADMAKLRGVLEQHVMASANSSNADRRMHKGDQAASAEQHSKTLETLREQHDQAIQQILVEKDVEFSKMAEGYKKQLNEVQLELLNNRQHMINTEAQWRKRVEDLEQTGRAEILRMREHFTEQVSRAKSGALAGAASSAAEGTRRGAGGVQGAPGFQGPAGGGSDHGGDDEHPKVRSLTLMLEESKKECRYVRDRNQELDRVVEALRKTIMRQAELSSQRQDHPQQGPPRNQPHVWRGGGGGGGGRTQHYHPQSMAGGVPGSRGSASTAGVHHDGHGPGGGGGGVGGHMHHHHHHGGGGGGRDLGGSGGRHEEMLPPHRHPVVSRALSDDSGRHGGVSSATGGRAGLGPSGMRNSGIGRGGPGPRPHSHQYQSSAADTMPVRRYTYDEPTLSSDNRVAMAPPHQHQQHGLPSFGKMEAANRDTPDRSNSQSAPPGGERGGGLQRQTSAGPGVMGDVGGTEYAAPVPRHHHGGRHGNAPGSSAVDLVSGGGAQWDRDPARNTMAFASMKYPPNTFPSGGAYGESTLFEQVHRQQTSDGKSNSSINAARALGGDLTGRAVGLGERGVGEMGGRGGQMRHSQSQGLLSQGHRSTPGLGVLSHETSPAGSSQRSPAMSAISGRGTPGPPPGLGSASQGGFSPSSAGSGMASATSSPSLQHLEAREARHGSGRGGRGSGAGAGQGSVAIGKQRASSADLDLNFDFGELDTSAVLGL